MPAAASKSKSKPSRVVSEPGSTRRKSDESGRKSKNDTRSSSRKRLNVISQLTNVNESFDDHQRRLNIESGRHEDGGCCLFRNNESRHDNNRTRSLERYRVQIESGRHEDGGCCLFRNNESRHDNNRTRSLERYRVQESILTQCSHATHRRPIDRDEAKACFDTTSTSLQSTTINEDSEAEEQSLLSDNDLKSNRMSLGKVIKKSKPPIFKLPYREKSSQPVVELFDWIVRPLPDIKGVCVEGQKKGMTDFWHSSAIIDVKRRNYVKTASGTVYKLIGKLNKLCTLETGFSKNIVHAFAHGFPADWKKLLQKFYSNLEHSISINDECSIVRGYSLKRLGGLNKKRSTIKSNIQRKEEVLDTLDSILTPVGLVKRCNSAENFTSTRSGRLSLPPLAHWQGQRYIISTKSNTLSVGFQTSMAEKALLRDTNSFMKLNKTLQKSLYHKSLSNSILECPSSSPINNIGNKRQTPTVANSDNTAVSDAKNNDNPETMSCKNPKSEIMSCSNPSVTGNTTQLTAVSINTQKIRANNNLKENQNIKLINDNLDSEKMNCTDPNVTVNSAQLTVVSRNKQKIRADNDLKENENTKSVNFRRLKRGSKLDLSPHVHLVDCSKDRMKTRSASKKKETSDRKKTGSARKKKETSEDTNYPKNASTKRISSSSSAMKCSNKTFENVLDCSIVLRSRKIERYDMDDNHPLNKSKEHYKQSDLINREGQKPGLNVASGIKSATLSFEDNSDRKVKRNRGNAGKHKQVNVENHSDIPVKNHKESTPKSVSFTTTAKRQRQKKQPPSEIYSTSGNCDLTGEICERKERKQDFNKKRKYCESPVSDDTGYSTEGPSCLKSQQDSTPKSCGKEQARKRRKLSLSAVTRENGQEETWTIKEKDLFERALKSVDANSPNFWSRVSAVVSSRTEIECRHFHTSYLELKTKKVPERKKVTRKSSGRQKGEPVRGGKGTLKRKDEIRDYLKEQDENYEDNLFDGSPFVTRKLPVPVISNIDFDKDDSEIFGSNHNFITPMTKSTKLGTPATRLRAQLASTRKTPSNQPLNHSINDTPVTVVRQMADKYIHSFMNQHKRNPQETSINDSETQMENTSKLDISRLPSKSLFSPSIVVYDKERQVEDEEEEDNPFIYYWDEDGCE